MRGGDLPSGVEVEKLGLSPRGNHRLDGGLIGGVAPATRMAGRRR
jgi:hypothetical protein